MSKVILDDALRAKLDLTNGPTELCSADGKPVAYVLSAEEYNRMLYDLAWAESAGAEETVADCVEGAGAEAGTPGDPPTRASAFAAFALPVDRGCDFLHPSR